MLLIAKGELSVTKCQGKNLINNLIVLIKIYFRLTNIIWKVKQQQHQHSTQLLWAIFNNERNNTDWVLNFLFSQRWSELRMGHILLEIVYDKSATFGYDVVNFINILSSDIFSVATEQKNYWCKYIKCIVKCW